MENISEGSVTHWSEIRGRCWFGWKTRVFTGKDDVDEFCQKV